MINHGMAKVRAMNSPWLPSPGEFCEWCKPSVEDYGLPSIEDAFNEARTEVGKHASLRKWSHDAVYLASVDTSFFDLKNLSDKSFQYKEVKARFSENYTKIVKRVQSGEVIKIKKENRIEQQPAISDTPQSKAAANSAVTNIMGLWND
jgi:hypothetical protein